MDSEGSLEPQSLVPQPFDNPLFLVWDHYHRITIGKQQIPTPASPRFAGEACRTCHVRSEGKSYIDFLIPWLMGTHGRSSQIFESFMVDFSGSDALVIWKCFKPQRNHPHDHLETLVMGVWWQQPRPSLICKDQWCWGENPAPSLIWKVGKTWRKKPTTCKFMRVREIWDQDKHMVASKNTLVHQAVQGVSAFL